MPTFRNQEAFEDVECLRQTDNAILCDIDGEQVWIPLSQVDDDSEVIDEGDCGRLVVSRWIAEAKGLA